MVWGEVGTDFPDYPINRVGDWDVVEKGLIVILYRHWRKLRLEVRMHILHDLLTSKGPRQTFLVASKYMRAQSIFSFRPAGYGSGPEIPTMTNTLGIYTTEMHCRRR